MFLALHHHELNAVSLQESLGKLQDCDKFRRICSISFFNSRESSTDKSHEYERTKQ